MSLDRKLTDAARAGNLKDVEAAIGPEMARLKPSQEALNKALSIAYRANNLEMMECLLFNGADPDVTIPNIIDRSITATMLQHAAYYGLNDKFKLLLQYSKFVDVTSSEGKTALHYAIEQNNGHLEFCGLLVDKGANLNFKTQGHGGFTPSSQIGMILKLGRIEIAKMIFAKQPQILAEFQALHPSTLSYICDSLDVERDVQEAMISYLLLDVPSLTVTENDISKIEKYHPDLLPLCVERMLLNQFWKACRENMGGKIKTQLFDALNAYRGQSLFKNAPNSLLASDILLILRRQHPFISKERFIQIFHDLLALFITPPNGKLCRTFSVMLSEACEYLIRTRQTDNHEAKVLFQLTLLTALHTISNSSEDTYAIIVRLFQAMIPDAQSFVATYYGEKQLQEFISQYPQDVKYLVLDLKDFYETDLKIKLTRLQVNPCSAVEKLLEEYKSTDAVENWHYYQQLSLHAEAELEEFKQNMGDVGAHINILQTEIEFLRAEKDAIAKSFTDAYQWKVKAQSSHHQLEHEIQVLREENDDLKSHNEVLLDRIRKLESEKLAARLIQDAKSHAVEDPDSPMGSPIKLSQRRERPRAKPPQKKKAASKKRVVEIEEEVVTPYVPAPPPEVIPARPTFFPPRKTPASRTPSPTQADQPIIVKVKRAKQKEPEASERGDNTKNATSKRSTRRK